MSERRGPNGERLIVAYAIRGPGCVYIGITVDPERRWACHRKESRASPKPLYSEMRRVGVRRFAFDVVATCADRNVPPGGWSKAANDLEAALIKQSKADGLRLLNVQLWGV